MLLCLGAGMIFNNKNPRQRSEKGVTLVELLVTLFILTIGISALIKFQGNYFYYGDLSKQRSEAVILAKSKLATLRNYQVLSTTSGYNAYEDISSGTSTTTATNTTYTITWSVTENTSPAYKTINVVVSWVDRNNNSQGITLSSIIGKIDPSDSGGLIYG